MSDGQAYERDPYLRTLATEVVAIGADDGTPWAVLADTILYPEGGGQPADRGTIAGVEVHDVQTVDGAVRHSLAAPLTLGPVSVELDWERRFDHMQQHSGQHLLTAVGSTSCASRRRSPPRSARLGRSVRGAYRPRRIPT